MFGVNPYQRIAGVGPTIDNVREYLLTLYARAYDAMDKHLIFGGVAERKATPQEIREVEARFNEMIAIAKKITTPKTVRILQKLKTLTLNHMRDKINAKQFVRELKKLLREYGIKTPEIERIERRIDEIESRQRAMVRAPNLFAQLDRTMENLMKPPKRGAPKQVRRRPPNPFSQLDRILSNMTKPLRRGRRRGGKR